jgi:hypothetical protein
MMMVIAILSVEFSLCAPALDMHTSVSASRLAWMHAVVAILVISTIAAIIWTRRSRQARARRGAEHHYATLREYLIGSGPRGGDDGREESHQLRQ